MNTIEIERKGENEKFTFEVKDENKLSRLEVAEICEKMNVKTIFIKGKIYNN